MIYLKPHNRRIARGRYVFLSVCVFFILVFFVLNFYFPFILPSLFMSVAKPFWRAEFGMEIGVLKSDSSLIDENIQLKQRLDDMSVSLQSVQFLESENNELKTILGHASTTSLYLAAVLMRPPFTPFDEIIIDIGRDHNLSASSTIFAAGNIPIGKVTELFNQTSKVSLFSSPGTRTDILIGSNHIPAIAIGHGGGQYQSDLPRDSNVQIGDFVIAPSLGDSIFAKVVSVDSDPALPFETILLAPPINVFGLKWVLADTVQNTLPKSIK